RRANDLRRDRENLAMLYMNQLAGVEGIRVPKYDPCHSWHLFVVLVEDRDLFVHRMGEKGIQCSVHFIPLHLHSYWQERLGVREGSYPNAERLYRRAVSLPLYTKMSRQDVIRVGDTVKAVLAEMGNASRG